MELKAENLTVSLQGKSILKEVDFTLGSGKHIVLFGPNGSGKTTLMKTIAGLVEQDKGTMYLRNTKLDTQKTKERAKAVAFVPSGYTEVFSYTVEDFLLMGKLAQQGIFYLPGKTDKEKVDTLLQTLEMGHLRGKLYGQCSSGEKQMCLIARGLMQNTPVLLLDEPVANLDFYYQHKLMDFINKITDSDKIVLTSLHDPNLALQYGDEILVLHEGRITKKICRESKAFAAEFEQVLQALYKQEISVKKVDNSYFVQRKIF